MHYSATYPILFFVNRMLQVKYGIDFMVAGSLFGLIHLTAAAILPTVGNLVDTNGGISITMVIGSIIGLLTNLLWLLLPTQECLPNHTCLDLVIFPIILSGIAYGLFAGTCWNGIFYLVERSKIGSALGI